MGAPDFPFEKRRVRVHGRTMATVDVGEGDPIVLLHGNPTSSFLWRHVIPHLEAHGRVVAPDLIGMGDSEKLEPAGPERYRFAEHRTYLDALFEALGVRENVTFVAHDWGTALAFDWAARHPGAVRALAYMEGFVRPLSWSEWPEAARGIFEAFRSPSGEGMCLEENLFVERVLPASVLRKLEPEEMEEYRRPFREPGEGRRPTLTWPREVPLEGEPGDVVEVVRRYARWLSESPVPKLFVNAEPGAILTGPQREFARRLPRQTEVTVPGVHFVQEDSGDAIGRAVAEWLRTL